MNQGPTLIESLKSIEALTESHWALPSYSHASQKNYLSNHILQLIKADNINKTIVSACEKPAILSTLVDLMLYAKYTVQANNNLNFKEKNFYLTEFNKSFAELEKQLSPEEVKSLLNELQQLANNKSFEFLNMISHGKTIAEKHQEALSHFYHAEVIGHDIAYNYHKADQHAVIADPFTNEEVTYIRLPLRCETNKVKNDGIIGEILIPQSAQITPTLYVAFAGTHSAATAKADLERSAGEESFRLHEDQIIKQIIQTVNNYHLDTGHKPVVRFTGHSLGGALAQLSYHSLQRALSSQIEDAPQSDQLFVEANKQYSENTQPINELLGKFNIDPNIVKGMSVDVWNSTGVLDTVSKSSNSLSKILNAKGITQAANYGYVDGDLVQATGQSNILSDIKNNDAKVTVFKKSNGQPGFITKAACTAGGVAWGSMMGFLIGGPPGSVIGAISCAASGAAATAYVLQDNHRQKHFTKGTILKPEEFALYYGDNLQHHDLILQEFNYKSMVVDKGLALLKAFNHTRSITPKLIELKEEQKESEMDPVAALSAKVSGLSLD